jgi:hypothetical protein
MYQERESMSDEIRDFIVREMEFLKANDRKFQAYLNENLSPDSDTYIRSHATIINMRVHGKAPNTDLLEDMLSVYPASDRRFRFALKMLGMKSPHIWGLGGVVWTLRVLNWKKNNK